MSVAIRPAVAADLPFCLGMAERLARVTELPWRGQAEMDRFQERFMRAALERPADGSATFLAEEGGEPLGFLHVEPAPDQISQDPSGYIALLAVIEAAEGRGVAQALMAAAEAFARDSGWRFLSLDVLAGNERAQSFYARCGFRPESLRLYRRVAEPISGEAGSPPTG